MFTAFRNRRPWAAALVTLICTPFIGMLYLGRGLFALLYLAAQTASFVILIAISVGHHVDAAQLQNRLAWIGFAISAIGAVHAFLIARKKPVATLSKWYARWYAIVAIFLVFPASAFLIRTFLFQPFHLPAASMSPSINPGDQLFVKKFSYANSSPQRGDIVAFMVSGRPWIKRVVGIEGDRVQLKDGKLYLNGVSLSKRIGSYAIFCGDSGCRTTREYVETQSNGHSYEVMYKAQGSTSDNTPVFVVPPSSYFMLGDNRDNSADSRNTLGYVANSAIIGKASVKFLNGRSHRLVWQAIN